MAWRLANSLVTYRNQINAMYPNRSKASDGTIGDAAHQAEGSASDHNPWIIDANGVGVVTAFDLTHDPANGVDIDRLSDELVATGDPRIKYIIANRLIWQRSTGWQNYYGTNPHTQHMHLSVNTNNFDNGSNWNLTQGGAEMPIQDSDHEYARWRQLGWFIRGRELSRDEFRKSAVGKTWLQAMEILADNPEANLVQHWQTVGRTAVQDKWDSQIYALQDQVKKLQAGESVTDAEIAELLKDTDAIRNKIANVKK